MNMLAILLGGILAMAHIAIPANAQTTRQTQKEFLDSISIPSHLNAPLTLKGRAAVETLIGEGIRIQLSGREYVMVFQHDKKIRFGRGSFERAATGSYRFGPEDDAVCIRLGGEHESCNRLELTDGKVLLTPVSGGVAHEGVFTRKFLTPAAAPVRVSLSPEVRAACEPLLQIIETGRRGRFDPLVDPAKEPLRLDNDIRDPIALSRIRIGNGCLVTSHMKEIDLNDHNCLIRTEPNAPEAERAYAELVGRIRQCLPGIIKQEKVQEKPGVDSDNRRKAVSIFSISDNLTIFALLGNPHWCRQYGFMNCRDSFGVTLRVRAWPNDKINTVGGDTFDIWNDSVRKLLTARSSP